MARKPTRDIICAECPDIYSEYEIMANRGEEVKPLVEVLGRTKPQIRSDAPVSKRRALGRLVGRSSGSGLAEQPSDSAAGVQREKLANLNRLRDWTFKCPKGHVVDGNRGYQIPLAVVGTSGSSKSHFLPGLIWETSLMRVLSPFGVTLRTGQFTRSELSYSMKQLYEEKKVLQPTDPTAVEGPFGYRLTVRENDEDTRYSLLLFDVGGEALSSIARIGEHAAFVLLAQGLIVLIDPHRVVRTGFDAIDGGPTAREQVIAAANVRDSITFIADALEELWEQPMKQIPVPACFAVAKADSLAWTFDWQAETKQVAQRVRQDGNLRAALADSSDRVREAFVDFGGALIVEEIEDRFDRSKVRFAAASATGEMAEDQTWADPKPDGISLTLLHLLDMLDKVHSRSAPESAQAESDAQLSTAEPTESAGLT